MRLRGIYIESNITASAPANILYNKFNKLYL